jgi:hypothetical protein
VGSLVITILIVLLCVGCFLAYWSGRQDGKSEEYEKHLEETLRQREKMLDLNLENKRLRRERDGYADEIARFWSAANQQHGDYVE